MTDEATIEATDIITIPHKTDVPALFSQDDGIEKLVERIEKEARSFAIDISTAKGRKEVKSLAAKVSRSKTLIDEVGKEQNEERNRLNKEVNALRNMAKERLDALRDEIKAPVDKWERAEADRVRALEIRMDAFADHRATAHDDSATIQGVIDAITATEIDATWEEYESDAKAAKAVALVKYQGDLAVAKAREAQAAELEALRAEKEARDREDAERKEAEQKAAAEAEQKARIQALADAKAREAEDKAKADAEAAEKRHKEELAEAAKREERAAQAERDRIAAEAKAEEDAAAARAADKKHRQKIRAEIVKAITDAKPENWEELVDAMIVGEIPHVKVMI